MFSFQPRCSRKMERVFATWVVQNYDRSPLVVYRWTGFAHSAVHTPVYTGEAFGSASHLCFSSYIWRHKLTPLAIVSHDNCDFKTVEKHSGDFSWEGSSNIFVTEYALSITLPADKFIYPLRELWTVQVGVVADHLLGWGIAWMTQAEQSREVGEVVICVGFWRPTM